MSELTEAQDLQATVNEVMSKAQKTETPQEQPQTQQTAEQPKEVPQESPKEPQAQEENLIEFVDEEQPQQQQIQTINYADIAKELGIEDAQGIDDIKAKWSEVNDNLTKYKVQSEERYANEKIRQLNDYVKQGGDIDSYLSRKENIRTIDGQIQAVKELNPIDAFKMSLKINGIDDETIEEYINTKSEVELKIEGTKIIHNEVNALAMQKNQLEQQEAADLENLQKRREQYQAKVSTELDNLSNVFGVKVNDKDRMVLKEVAKDAHQILRKYFPVDENGNIKADVLAKNVALLELGNKYASQLRKMAQGEGQRKVFDKLQNVPSQGIDSQTLATEGKKDDKPKVNGDEIYAKILQAYQS